METNHSPSLRKKLEHMVDCDSFIEETDRFKRWSGQSLKELAKNAGVSYYMLMGARSGRELAYDVIPKVRAYMSSVIELSHEKAVE